MNNNENMLSYGKTTHFSTFIQERIRSEVQRQKNKRNTTRNDFIQNNIYI